MTCTQGVVMYRGHLRSVCSWDQNGIMRSMVILGADQGIKTNSE